LASAGASGLESEACDSETDFGIWAVAGGFMACWRGWVAVAGAAGVAWAQEAPAVKDGASPSSAIVLRAVPKVEVGAPTETSSAEEAMAWLLTRGLARTKGQVEVAGRILDAASLEEPSNARWLFGRALVLRTNGQRTAAREMMERAVKIEPESAAHQFWYGTMIFESINDAPTLKKMGLADTAMEALEKSLKLDPEQPMARYSMAQFYINAPGIAGGSLRKAREQAKMLFAMKEGKGEFLGHLVLALAAAEDGAWKEMGEEFEAAETAGGEGADPRASLLGHIDCLLRKKEDPKAALALIERYAAVADSTDDRPHVLLGEARRMMKDYAGAVGPFAKAVEMNGKSKTAVWGLAESAEKTGDVERAIGQYRAYAAAWPEDERAGKAKWAAERLERKRK